MLSRLFQIFSSCIIKRYTTIQLQNSETLHLEGPFIICANHSSHLDSAVIMKLFGGNSENYALLAAYDYWFENKIRKFFFTRALNLIPIDRRKGGEKVIELNQTMELCREFLAERPNGKIIIFPNGSRINQADEIKPGVAILALNLKLDIVIVKLSGTEKIFPPKSRWFSHSKVKVETYPPIKIHNFLNDVQTTYQTQIQNILDQIRSHFS